MWNYIPFELQLQIIIRLPVKSLIQFRSVSKIWKSLIDSSEFIADHSLRHTQPERLLVRYKDPVTSKDNYVSFVDDDTFPHQKFAPTVPLSVELLTNSRIVGSSHGLFCLYGYYHRPGGTPRFRTGVAVVWNPSIRKSIAFDVPNVLHRPYKTVLGFGVCPVNNDPKVVKIRQFGIRWVTTSNSNKAWKVEVYTLSSGKWRSLSSNLPPQSIQVTWSQVVIDKFIYWCAYDRIAIDGGFRNNYLIMSFDITNENFRVVDLPYDLALQDALVLSISKLRESLVVLEDSISIEKQDTCVVWVMEHGVQKSFTKLFTIKAHLPIRTMGFRKCGEPVMEMEDDYEYSLRPTALVVYEPNSQHVNDTGFYGKNYSFSVNFYMETLLLLDRSDCLSY